MIGYSVHIRDLNRKAKNKHLGVRLGKFCIANNIPVTQVMGMFDVSKQTVYNWFSGKHAPKPHHQELIIAHFPM